MVQHLMSGERTPTLSGTLPAFQSLQDCWEEHALQHPEVKRYVLEGMTRLNKYHERAGRTRAYVIAMGMLRFPWFHQAWLTADTALNPSIKLHFINKNWSPIEQEMAVEWVKDEVSFGLRAFLSVGISS